MLAVGAIRAPGHLFHAIGGGELTDLARVDTNTTSPINRA